MALLSLLTVGNLELIILASGSHMVHSNTGVVTLFCIVLYFCIYVFDVLVQPGNCLLHCIGFLALAVLIHMLSLMNAL